MYEKAVHKDGIRRTVMTSTGNSTERYFDKKDLRKLFELAPAGTCEVLDKIQAKHNHEPMGSSGKPTFLTSHPGVVGVSSHDDIYLSAVNNVPDSGEIATPFGGSSANKPPRVLGRAQKVLSKRRIDFSSGGGEKENSPDKIIGSTSETAIDVDMAVEQGNRLLEAEIEALLGKADSLREQGNEVEATSILLDLVENETVKGEQKLLVHQGLAELGRSLGELYNDTTA
jgi:hypothetical protein